MKIILYQFRHAGPRFYAEFISVPASPANINGRMTEFTLKTQPIRHPARSGAEMRGLLTY